MEENYFASERYSKQIETAGIRQLLTHNLVDAKSDLKSCLIDEFRKCMLDGFEYDPEFKAKGEIKYHRIVHKHKQEWLKFNMKKGDPNSPDIGLDKYRWIIIDRLNANENFIKSYCLGLCREDLQQATGNIHQDFTKLQMSICRYKKMKIL